MRNLWCACDTVVVVLGANAKLIRKRTEDEFVRLVETGCFDQELHAAHRHKAQKLEVRFVVNRAWKKGMYSSARVGLEAALKYDPAGLFVLPVDHPSVRPATVLDLGDGDGPGHPRRAQPGPPAGGPARRASPTRWCRATAAAAATPSC